MGGSGEGLRGLRCTLSVVEPSPPGENSTHPRLPIPNQRQSANRGRGGGGNPTNEEEYGRKSHAPAGRALPYVDEIGISRKGPPPPPAASPPQLNV